MVTLSANGPQKTLNYEYEYDFEGNLEDIIAEVSTYYPQFGSKEERKIREAYWFGFDAHIEQKRSSGEPYFMHPVEATKILLSIRPDIETIIACLLHDVIEDTPFTASQMGQLFGERIQFLCEGVEKVSQVRIRKNEQNHKFDSIQKLFVAVAKDIRVIFVKLADRIHNLSTLEHVRPENNIVSLKSLLRSMPLLHCSLGCMSSKFKSKICAFSTFIHKTTKALLPSLISFGTYEKNSSKKDDKNSLSYATKKTFRLPLFLDE